MKLKVKNKKFFKELRKLYKDSTRSSATVSPGLVGEGPEFIDLCFDDGSGNASGSGSGSGNNSGAHPSNGSGSGSGGVPEWSEGPSQPHPHTSPHRKIGKTSYRKTKYTKLNKSKLDALMCFKVLGLKTFPNSNKIKLIDTLTGKVYNTTMPNLTKNACAYETRLEALSERLPARLVGARTSERLCRVLVSFECWGETHRRLGGGNGCSEYEFLRFMKIEQSLDSPAQHSLKAAAQPVPPHFYPNCDKSFGKSTGRKSTKRCVTSVGPNPTFRTAMMTKEARLKVVFSKDCKMN